MIRRRTDLEQSGAAFAAAAFGGRPGVGHKDGATFCERTHRLTLHTVGLNVVGQRRRHLARRETGRFYRLFGQGTVDRVGLGQISVSRRRADPGQGRAALRALAARGGPTVSQPDRLRVRKRTHYLTTNTIGSQIGISHESLFLFRQATIRAACLSLRGTRFGLQPPDVPPGPSLLQPAYAGRRAAHQAYPR